jgi:tight adherence protein B
MDGLILMLGRNGIMGAIGLMIFFFSYKYSIGIFNWVEKQTLGTRTYILEKFELLFIEVKPEHVTYFLLGISVGLGSITLGLFGLFGMWLAGFILGSVIMFLGFKIPKPVVDSMIKKRLNQYADQMVDALTLLANGIRAGLSVPQALGMVVDEMPAPVSQEFNMILQQNKIGVPLEECFENLAKRVPLEDNDMFVTGVNILRETGGNLAETFDTIVGVIRERIRLKQKIDQLTASGVFQGYTIACMPFAIGIIFTLNDPQSMARVFTNPLGIAMMAFALILDFIGLVIIMKIVKIDT